MRKLFLLLIAFIFSNFLSAQDIIHTQDGEQLDVKIVERTNRVVKYEMPDYENNPPIISIKTSKIRKIEYKNGYVDKMGMENPRNFRPIGVGIGPAFLLAGEVGIYSGTIDYFITPQIELEGNFGATDMEAFYYAVGGKYHLNSDDSESNFTPFAGLMLGSEYDESMIQIPIGINYLSKKGFSASLSLNRIIYFNDDAWTYIELKVGYNFKMEQMPFLN